MFQKITITLLLLITCFGDATAQRKTRARLKTLSGNTLPLAYRNWPMIFNENFDSLDLNKWDRSTALPVDDFPCDVAGGDPYFFMKPENVFVKDGFCHILATKKTSDKDTLCQPKVYCGGEIKSFTYSKSEVDPFRNYSFPTDTYIEARVKTMSSDRCHLGSLFWLWGLTTGQELDIMETSGAADNAFSMTLHEHAMDKHPTQRIYVKDSTRTNIDMTSMFLTVGCMYSDSIIRLFVNGQEVSQQKTYRGLFPFGLRLGTSYVTMARWRKNPLPPDDCMPSEFLIDYVRVYQNPKRTSMYWESKPENIAKEGFFKTNYYPDAKYEWIAPGFEIRKEPWDAWNVVKLKPTSKLKKGSTQLIKVIITFPKGYSETLTCESVLD